jgi:Type IV pili methyl-accepting chemotaxis transducer N-term
MYTKHLKRRRLIKGSLALLGLGTLAHAQNAQATDAIVVNRSARMRALSQRIVKLKAQQVLQVSPEIATETLLAAEKLMKSHLQFLQSSVPSGFRGSIDLLTASVGDFLKLVKGASGKEELVALNDAAGKVLVNADKLTAEMVSASKQTAVAVVNISGRQRMLSQRMTKHYMFIAAGASIKDLPSLVDADRKLFAEAMTTLASNPLADSKVMKEITHLSDLYKKIDLLLVDRSEKAMAKPNLVSLAALSEQVLASAHDLTLLFEESVLAKSASAKG